MGLIFSSKRTQLTYMIQNTWWKIPSSLISKWLNRLNILINNDGDPPNKMLHILQQSPSPIWGHNGHRQQRPETERVTNKTATDRKTTSRNNHKLKRLQTERVKNWWKQKPKCPIYSLHATNINCTETQIYIFDDYIDRSPIRSISHEWQYVLQPLKQGEIVIMTVKCYSE